MLPVLLNKKQVGTSSEIFSWRLKWENLRFLQKWYKSQVTDERKGRLGLGTGCPQDVWQKGSCFSYILRVHQETFWININWRSLLTFTLDRRRFFFLRNPHEHCDQLGLRHGYQADQPRGEKKNLWRMVSERMKLILVVERFRRKEECHEVQLGRLRPNMRKKKCHSNVSWCNRPPRGGLGHPRASCFKE